MLNPSTPKEGVDLKKYLTSKYGAAATANFGDPNSSLNQAATSLGFAFKSSRRIVNSLDGHRLVELAKTQGKSDAVMKNLFISYFENAENISDVAVLKRIGNSSGMDSESVSNLYEETNKSYVKEITQADLVFKQQKRISGVPYILASCEDSEKPYLLQGAPSPELLNALFEKCGVL